MQSLRRTAVTAARKGRTTLPRQPRRYAHDEHHGHGHAHSEPVNESFGAGFWVTVGCFPAGWALYAISRQEPDAPSYLTRIIEKYQQKHDRLLEINALHTTMMEQAGEDRVLFQNTKSQTFVDMRFPEIMNVGSPYNVPAGSQANMDKVIEKFRREAYEDNERKHEALRNNKIKSEQPIEEVVGYRFRGVAMRERKE